MEIFFTNLELKHLCFKIYLILVYKKVTEYLVIKVIHSTVFICYSLALRELCTVELIIKRPTRLLSEAESFIRLYN